MVDQLAIVVTGPSWTVSLKHVPFAGKFRSSAPARQNPRPPNGFIASRNFAYRTCDGLLG